MIVEIIGPTSAGKSTLVKRLVACQGMETAFRVPIKLDGRLSGLLLTDLIAVFKFFNPKTHTMLDIWTLFKICLNRQDTLLMRLNLFRNFIKKQGLVKHYRSSKFHRKIVIMDEGGIHAYNNVFSQHSEILNPTSAQRLLHCISLPDLIIRINVDFATMVKRANSRPDPPWLGLNEDNWKNIHTSTNKIYELVLGANPSIQVIALDAASIDAIVSHSNLVKKILDHMPRH